MSLQSHALMVFSYLADPHGPPDAALRGQPLPSDPAPGYDQPPSVTQGLAMRSLWLGLFLLSALHTPAAAQEKLPVRLFAEAEDFSIKSGWSVMPYRDNYYAGTF